MDQELGGARKLYHSRSSSHHSKKRQRSEVLIHFDFIPYFSPSSVFIMQWYRIKKCQNWEVKLLWWGGGWGWGWGGYNIIFAGTFNFWKLCCFAGVDFCSQNRIRNSWRMPVIASSYRILPFFYFCNIVKLLKLVYFQIFQSVIYFNVVTADTKILVTLVTTRIFSSCKLTIPTGIIFPSNLCYIFYFICKMNSANKELNWIINFHEVNLLLNSNFFFIRWARLNLVNWHKPFMLSKIFLDDLWRHRWRHTILDTKCKIWRMTS